MLSLALFGSTRYYCRCFSDGHVEYVLLIDRYDICHALLLRRSFRPLRILSHDRTKRRSSSRVSGGGDGDARIASAGSNPYTSSSFSSLASTVSTTTDPGDPESQTRTLSPTNSVDSGHTNPLESRVPRDENIERNTGSSNGIKGSSIRNSSNNNDNNNDAGQSGIYPSTAHAWGGDDPRADTNAQQLATIKQHQQRLQQQQQQASSRIDKSSITAVTGAADATRDGVPVAGSGLVPFEEGRSAVAGNGGSTNRRRSVSRSSDTALQPPKDCTLGSGEGRKVGGGGDGGSRGGNKEQRSDVPVDVKDGGDHKSHADLKGIGSGVSSASGSSFCSSRTDGYSDEESDMSRLSSSYSGGGEDSGSVGDSSFSDDYGKRGVYIWTQT